MNKNKVWSMCLVPLRDLTGVDDYFPSLPFYPIGNQLGYVSQFFISIRNN
jgi:hypothetical protein